MNVERKLVVRALKHNQKMYQLVQRVCRTTDHDERLSLLVQLESDLEKRIKELENMLKW